MRIAVITPYFQEPISVLDRCHQSVRRQTTEADHFFIADGFPNPEIDKFGVYHAKLPRAHGDNGNTPRGVGSLLAQSAGYDFIAYLDADNWFFECHLEVMLSKHRETRAEVITAFRVFFDHEGRDLKVFEPAEDTLQHVDTSCFFLSRGAFGLLQIWSQMPRELGPVCDRVFLAAVKHSRFACVSSRLRTVGFSTQYEYHYRRAGLPAPVGSKAGNVLLPALTYLKTDKGIRECIERIGFWPLPYIQL